MRRWGMPLLVIAAFFGVAFMLAQLPTEADKEHCHASALEIVTGKELHVPEELAHKCHEEARKEMMVAALPAAGGLISTVVTIALVRRADDAGEDAGDDEEGGGDDDEDGDGSDS